MSRSKIPIVEMLAATLRSFTAESLSAGHWSSASGPAAWFLEPAADGFWLLLGESEGANATPDLGLPDEWPWPFKCARPRPGAAARWQADLFLRGRPAEAQSLNRILRTAQAWLTNSAQPEAPSTAEPVMPLGDLIADVLDLRAEPGSSGAIRVLTGADLPIEICCEHDAIRVVGKLLTLAAPLSSTAALALTDMLDVANARLRGCRAVSSPFDTAEPAARIEAQIPLTDLTPEALRQSVTRVGKAQAALTPGCQALCDGCAAEVYCQCLLSASRQEA